MPRHTLYHADLQEDAREAIITGDEAKHALRVKRIREGDEVGILNGRGLSSIAIAHPEGRDLRLEVRTINVAERVKPRIDVWSATPKGPRSGELIDGLSQAGAHTWAPLATDRANVDPSDARIDRLSRVALEAAKQCGRAWMLEIDEAHTLEDAANGDGASVVMADASGDPYESNGADSIRLLIGPEGGWSPGELAKARDAGVRIASFGPHVMRIEMAAPVACAVILDLECRYRETSDR